MGNLFRSSKEIDRALVLTPVYIKGSEEIPNPGNGTVEQKRTRHYGDTDLSPELRTLIALTGAVTGPQIAAKTWNVSPSKASQLARGIISDGAMGEKIDENLRAKVMEKKLEVNKLAIDLMFQGLGSVTVAEVSGLDVKDRLKAIKDLGDIADKTSPVEERTGNGQSVVIYAPRMVSMDTFPTLVTE